MEKQTDKVKVLVFDRPCLVSECTGEACMPGPAARCSLGKEVRDQFEILKEEVERRFGNQAEVIYIDVNRDERANRYEAAMAVLARMVEPPVVTVEGEVIGSGEIPVKKVIDYLQGFLARN
ncbi:disulfide oxidoreductase YuzD [Thermosulfuriphilus ammonigenes]|uniref:DUF1462 family protein n=1 Tax=Thermosulfuriphilus ammonigenes TaxID=1936021 RepID=UPI00178D37E9|nr:DUF1462 family protein [Thermosulfuriphilus ammonigenes]MBA2848969.1 disulfide oxidoreductase YuzD [Thermosulfuriphilus ammonigenes]